MLRFVLVALCACIATAGCALDPHRDNRPARLRLGTNARHFTSTSAAPIALRRAPASASSESSTTTVGHEGVTGSAQFTMTTHRSFYLGGELEAGTLDNPGSNVAGAYAVAGAQHAGRFGSLGVEVVGGWRALRYSLGDEQVSKGIIEPRVKAELWLSPKLTFGGTAGATLGEEGVWMAGLFLGVHSNWFNSAPF
ncbi:MAG: hypothetical protein ABI867_13525 [Kofleriaceae bacterium]